MDEIVHGIFSFFMQTELPEQRGKFCYPGSIHCEPEVVPPCDYYEGFICFRPLQNDNDKGNINVHMAQ